MRWKCVPVDADVLSRGGGPAGKVWSIITMRYTHIWSYDHVLCPYMVIWPYGMLMFSHVVEALLARCCVLLVTYQYTMPWSIISARPCHALLLVPGMVLLLVDTTAWATGQD